MQVAIERDLKCSTTGHRPCSRLGHERAVQNEGFGRRDADRTAARRDGLRVRPGAYGDLPEHEVRRDP